MSGRAQLCLRTDPASAGIPTAVRATSSAATTGYHTAKTVSDNTTEAFHTAMATSRQVAGVRDIHHAWQSLHGRMLRASAWARTSPVGSGLASPTVPPKPSMPSWECVLTLCDVQP